MLLGLPEPGPDLETDGGTLTAGPGPAFPKDLGGGVMGRFLIKEKRTNVHEWQSKKRPFDFRANTNAIPLVM